MANMYATPDQLIARAPNLESRDEDELEDELTAASRWIDAHCARKFWLDPTATIRVFKACDLYVLDLGAHEIGAATPVTVKTDDGGGTFGTTVSASNYQLGPVNAPFSPVGPAPYTTLRAISTSWPVTHSPSGRQELVQITARYGWPEVPPSIVQACLTLALDGFENPTGVRSEAIDGYSVSYTATAEQAAAKKLNVYRRRWAA